ncbi:hypothetical protein E0H39_03280 [Rhizobium leguminosarum bv. viciae]|uniref:hypothetical protein n=1 Tax=Rhizobium leguminosarum TaxID=384 RepID=UPI000B9277A2|nr:hypothetical protein [Rhizobium leguminosarum]ASS57561.1 hypothetical protein CHR56_25085 [Rhizobium leguminosarum bv. viciae]TBY17516.1 hypothetical protein E0H30_26205 [Rhizobium leguminosarum bv. viciae]TBY24594.1 hypothetical protein E0H37_23010 [Rhizobium leguminosarum bv. viciae]TBY66491.1 hypothetical protein E0H39_03280 [Rhizobium leguminosarum bv. viciae]TBY99740.1 hypothetical protein E0H49_17665 [Rhizobium leguminosarum bv. viciae]
MSLLSLLYLDDHGIELVSNAVRQWCQVRHVSIQSIQGQKALNIAVDKVLAGERSPAAIVEAIDSGMQVEIHKDPHG